MRRSGIAKLCAFLGILTASALGQAPATAATNTKDYSDYCKVDWEPAQYFVQKKPGGKWETIPGVSEIPFDFHKVATVRLGRFGGYLVVTDSIDKDVLTAQTDCYSPDGKLQFTYLEFGRPGKWFWEQYFEMTADELRPKGRSIFNSSDRKYILLDIPKDAGNFQKQMLPTVAKKVSDIPFLALVKQRPKDSKK